MELQNRLSRKKDFSISANSAHCYCFVWWDWVWVQLKLSASPLQVIDRKQNKNYRNSYSCLLNMYHMPGTVLNSLLWIISFSFNPFINPGWKSYYLCYFTWWKWEAGRLKNLPRVTQVVSGRAGAFRAQSLPSRWLRNSATTKRSPEPQELQSWPRTPLPTPGFSVRAACSVVFPRTPTDLGSRTMERAL